MPLAAGVRLGPYEIVTLIGTGGMGEVYRARDPRLGRDVAVKVLPSAFAADTDRLRRFEQEARAAAALNHPNILRRYLRGTELAVCPSQLKSLTRSHATSRVSARLLGSPGGAGDAPLLLLNEGMESGGDLLAHSDDLTTRFPALAELAIHLANPLPHDRVGLTDPWRTVRLEPYFP
jgi:hypothetical protein